MKWHVAVTDMVFVLALLLAAGAAIAGATEVAFGAGALAGVVLAFVLGRLLTTRRGKIRQR